MEKGLLALQAALSSVVAVQTNKYLLTQTSLSPLAALLCAGALSVVAATLMDWVFKVLPKKSKLLRSCLDPRCKYEGVWILTLEGIPLRPYSYATIEYNPVSANYIYSGTGFELSGKVGSTWSTSELDFNHTKNEIRFFAESQLADSDAEFVKNWGYIAFEKESFGKEFTRGKGFFVDIGTKFLKSHFYLERMSPKDIEDLVHKKSLRSHQDMAELIHAYHQKRLLKISDR